MRIIKRQLQREKDRLKIYAELKKDFDRKLEFKTQEIRSEALRDVAELKSKIRRMRQDHLIEIKQIRNESIAKSKRLDAIINEHQVKSSVLQNSINEVNTVAALLMEMLRKYSSELYQERKHIANLNDDINSIKGYVDGINNLKLVKKVN